MRLVDNWKHAWKWASVRLIALGVALQLSWLSIPEDMKHSVPQPVLCVLTLAVLLGAFIGRLVLFKEPKKPVKKAKKKNAVAPK